MEEFFHGEFFDGEIELPEIVKYACSLSNSTNEVCMENPEKTSDGEKSSDHEQRIEPKQDSYNAGR